jgi:predicted dehydrogenase
MMAGPIRVGFIGCGGNASGHIGQVLQIPEAEVAALCDPSQASLDRALERNEGARHAGLFSDHPRMLDEVELDAVEISTPHTLHFQQIMDSLDRGCHVLTEKPMVCTVDHAHQVIRRARETERILMVSYQRHLEPVYRFVRNQVRAGELGQVQFVSALQDQGWYRAQQGQWRQDPALSGGGQLNDSGSHLLDILLWMTGLEAAEVHAFMENFESEVDINSAMNVRFANGALGNISVVGNSPASGIWEDITIWGTRAAVMMRNGRITWREAGAEPCEPANLPGGSTPDRNFVDAILGRDEVQVPPQCGLRVIELTEAAWESARTGRPAAVSRS